MSQRTIDDMKKRDEYLNNHDYLVRFVVCGEEKHVYCNAVDGDAIKGAMSKIINMYKAEGIEARFEIGAKSAETYEDAIDILKHGGFKPRSMVVTTSDGEHRYDMFSYASTKAFLKAEKVIEDDSIKSTLEGTERLKVTCRVNDTERTVLVAEGPMWPALEDREAMRESMIREAKKGILASEGRDAFGLQVGDTFIVTKGGKKTTYYDFDVKPALPPAAPNGDRLKAFWEYHRLSYFEPMADVSSMGCSQKKGE